MPKQLSIYDPEDEPSSQYVALEEQKNDFHPFVRQFRVATFSLMDKAKSYVTKAEEKVTRAQSIYKTFMDNVPAREKNPISLLVVGVAGMTGTLTYPHRPFLRRLVVVPSLVLGSSLFCFPKTTKYVIQTGLNHSGHNVDLETLAGDPVDALPSLDTVASSVSSGIGQLTSLLTSSPEISPLKEEDLVKYEEQFLVRKDGNSNKKGSIVDGAAPMAVDDGIDDDDIDEVVGMHIAEEEANNEREENDPTSSPFLRDTEEEPETDIVTDVDDDSDDSNDSNDDRNDEAIGSSATGDVILVVPQDGAPVSEMEGDIGQSNPDDLQSYSNRK